MFLRSYITSQFRLPRGLVGRLAGHIMARSNRELNAWVPETLAPRATDRLLEIGFGPGTLIAELARLFPEAVIFGVDPSPEMLLQARRRNLAAIRRGRVVLRHGTAEALRFPEAHFDRACAVNVSSLWVDPVAALREIRRVLKPGGVLGLAQQPRWVTSSMEARLVGYELIEACRAAGFSNLELHQCPMRPVDAIYVRGITWGRPVKRENALDRFESPR